MRMSQRRNGLASQIQRTCRRHAPLDSIGQGLLTQLHGNYEMIIDIARVQHRQDVWMTQLGCDLHLVQELFLGRAAAGLRYL